MASAQTQQNLEIFRYREAIQTQLHQQLYVDEVAVKRLELSIQKMLDLSTTSTNIKAALYHELAYLSAFKLKIDQAMSYMDTSESLGMNAFGALVSRMFLLGLNGRFGDIREAVERFDLPEPHDSDNRLIVSHLVEAGMLNLACERLIAAGDPSSQVVAAGAVLRSIGATDAELNERLDFAARLLVEEVGAPLIAYKFFAMEGEGILYQFVVRADIDTLAALDQKLSDAIVDHFDAALDEYLSISVIPFVPNSVIERMDAYHVDIGR